MQILKAVFYLSRLGERVDKFYVIVNVLGYFGGNSWHFRSQWSAWEWYEQTYIPLFHEQFYDQKPNGSEKDSSAPSKKRSRRLNYSSISKYSQVNHQIKEDDM